MAWPATNKSETMTTATITVEPLDDGYWLVWCHTCARPVDELGDETNALEAADWHIRNGHTATTEGTTK